MTHHFAAVVTVLVFAAPAAARADAEDEARRMFMRGKDALARGDLEVAAEAFARAVDLDVTEVGARRYLGRTRAMLGQWDLAVDAYRGYLELVPSAPDAHVVRQALKDLIDRSRRAEPRPALPGRPARVVPPTKQAVEPGSPGAAAAARRHYDLGRTLNDNSAAEENHYRAAVSLDPTFAPAYYNLGILYLTRGDMERAIWAHTRFSALTPEGHEGPFLLGVDHQMRGDLAAAEQAYRRALGRDPDHFDSVNNLAVVLEKQGRFDEAAGWYQRAIHSAPSGSALRARYNLGDLYLKQAKVDEAVALFSEVLEIAARTEPKPGRSKSRVSLLSQTHNALGRAHELRHDRAAALSQYTAALTISPSDREARSNLLRLRAAEPQ